MADDMEFRDFGRTFGRVIAAMRMREMMAQAMDEFAIEGLSCAAMMLKADLVPLAVRTVYQGYTDRPRVYEWTHPKISLHDGTNDIIYVSDRESLQAYRDKGCGCGACTRLRTFSLDNLYAHDLLHELAHSLSAPHRLGGLDRSKLLPLGIANRTRAEEEIIAESTAQRVMKHYNFITPTEQITYDELFRDGFFKEFRDNADMDRFQVEKSLEPRIVQRVDYLTRVGDNFKYAA